MTDLRILNLAVAVVAVLLNAKSGLAQGSPRVEPVLGPAPGVPPNVLSLPSSGARNLDVTAGFTVNGNSREQVRQFYNAV
jgi:hypothetical protein